MLRTQEKFVDLCKGLKLPLNGKTCSNTYIIVDQIFEKYFENKILVPDMAPWNNPCKNLRQSLLTSSNQTRYIAPSKDDVWIFGYGSLVWRPDFPFIDRKRGYILGYRRLFYQNSIDHRGTIVRPGRVVTLLPSFTQESRVYGIAYRISAEHSDEVLAHLDYREKNGYERCVVNFFEYPEESNKQFEITMYIATPDNTSYAGHMWHIPTIAKQIFTAVGSSGPNREYLFNLANAMRELFPDKDDRHLFELETAVKDLIKDYEPKLLEKALKKEIREMIELGNADGDVDETISDVVQLYEDCSQPGWREDLLHKEMEAMNESKQSNHPLK